MFFWKWNSWSTTWINRSTSSSFRSWRPTDSKPSSMPLRTRCRLPFKAIGISLSRFKAVTLPTWGNTKKKLEICKSKFRVWSHNVTKCFKKRKLWRMRRHLSFYVSNSLRPRSISWMRILSRFRDKWGYLKFNTTNSKPRQLEWQMTFSSFRRSFRTAKTSWCRKNNSSNLKTQSWSMPMRNSPRCSSTWRGKKKKSSDSEEVLKRSKSRTTRWIKASKISV